MPVVPVSGGYEIKGSYKGKPKMIGHEGRPFKSRKQAQRVSDIRASYKHRGKRR